MAAESVRAEAWKSIGCMLAGVGLVIGCDALSKILTERYPVEQILGVRQLIAMAPLLLFARFGPGLSSLRTDNAKVQLIRGFLFFLATGLVVTSLKYLPLPTVNAIGFSAPILVAALSLPALREPVGLKRWLAILVGFAGVLLIVRPGMPSFDWLILLPVAVAMTNSLRDVVTRRLTRTDSSLAILFWSSVVVLVFSVPTAPFSWRPLEIHDIGLFILSGCLYASAHLLMIEAFRYGRAAAVASYRYSGLIWSVIFAYAIWGHIPDWAVFIGAAMIAGGSIYMLHQEVNRNA